MENSIFKVLEELESQSNLEKNRRVDVAPNDRMLAITKETGELLNLMMRLYNAQNVLEIGMSTGYSTIWFAEALKENKKTGKIITIEQNPNKIRRAKENFEKAKVNEIIEIKEGLAMEILTELSLDTNYKEFFDFVFIDADKEKVIEYFDKILPMVSKGGLVVTDNMIYPEKYKEDMKKLSNHIRDNPNLKSITSPIGNGEEITLKIK
ncbi:O-methyltransferase [Nitrosopumilus sp.]|uniref:O-methyltransferase n=1 Tax=Nitrosopumilus sp. TaxID=2024843 RepID=UPI003B599719